MCIFLSGGIGGGWPAGLVGAKLVSILCVCQQPSKDGVDLPAGSLRCERFVRSSLASSMVGFMSGGSDGSFPDWRPSKETSCFLIYNMREREGLGQRSELVRRKAWNAYLAIL